MNFCCKEFEKATKEGTDAEGYGPLILIGSGWLESEWAKEHPNEPWTMGCDLESIKFCPWCGKELVV
jgi:hypothetical protein